MNQNSEIVSMKAAGISAHQIIAPLIAASVAIAAFAFLFQELVVTRATAALNDWQAVEYGRLESDDGIATNAWVRDGDDLILAEQVTGTGARSEEHTSELQSLMRISYAVFCLKKKKKQYKNNRHTS